MNERFLNRRRVAAGLVLGAAIAASLGGFLLHSSIADEARVRAERLGIVEVRAVADLVERAGITGEQVRKAVALRSGGPAQPAAIRVLAFEGLSLEASTAPGDRGDLAAPRRLRPDEKPFFDLGQRLRAAVQTNREEGSARKDEIEIRPAASGGLILASPLERDGGVVGIVEVETKPAPPVSRTGWLAALLAFAVPVLAFLALAAAAGERRAVLIAASAILLAGTLVVLSRRDAAIVAAERVATADAVRTRVVEAKTGAVALLAELGLEASSIRPSAWDTDSFRRPRGIVSAEGTVLPGPLAADVAGPARRLARGMAGTGVLAVAVLLFVGTGLASRLAATLRRYREAYVYTLPALVGMLLLVFFPFFYGIALSFTDSNIYNSEKPITETWIGIRNFVEILGDFHVARRTAEGFVFNYQNFYWTLFFTVAWTIANVAIGVTVGLFLALILNTRGLALRPVYRVLLILPWAMPNYITALTWKGMFHPQFGVINQVLQIFGGQAVAWSDKTWTSFLSILATNGWLSFPFMMVISLGALQSIPADLYEAARVDGASRWQQFRSITLPSLKPALVPAIILSVIWTFNMFNIPYLVSAGEPSHSTEILITQAYKFAFEQYRYGYAAAYSTVIFGILLIYGTWQNRVTRATEGI